MIRLTLKSLWSHKRRLISTSVAVILGVAFMAGTLVLNATVGRVFDDLFANLGQGTDAVVRGEKLFEGHDIGTQRAFLSGATVARVAKVAGVAKAEGNIVTFDLTVLDRKGDAMGGNGPPTIVGSWTYDTKLASYQVDKGRSPMDRGEAIVDRAAFDKGKFKLGGKLAVITPKGRENLRIVGVSKFGTADSAGGSIFVATTLREAQRLAGQPGKLSTVDTRAGPGVSPGRLVASIDKATVAPRADVVTGKQAADEQASEVKKGFGFFTIALLVFAAIALFVGIFIISNTFTILVAQRTRELALLRALGASRRQVLGSVLLESGLIGAVSALVGFAAGVGLAGGALALLRALGIGIPSASLVVPLVVAVEAIVVGLAVTMGASLLPAIRATRVAPIEALRDPSVERGGPSWIRAGIGAAALVLGALAISPAFGKNPTQGQLPAVGLGLLLAVVGVLLLAPVLAGPLARAVGAPLPAIKGLTGRLARQNAMRSPRRTAATASALIIGVALVTFITIFAASAQRSITSSIDTGFTGDFIAQPVNQFGGVGVTPKVALDLAKVNGVERVTAAAFTPAQLTLASGAKPETFVSSVDPKTYPDLFDIKMAQGQFADLVPGTMFVDKAAAREKKVKLGDRVQILIPEGRRGRFRVVGLTDEANLLGQWSITRADLSKLVSQPTDQLIGIKLAKGTSVEDARPDLRNVLQPYPNMKLQDRDQFTSNIISQISALLNVIYGLLAVSVIIALIGIGNTISLSIFERTRELGL
ncbi:MAG: ABC transporter permease, partial [Acidimicrobiales bacterium]